MEPKEHEVRLAEKLLRERGDDPDALTPAQRVARVMYLVYRGDRARFLQDAEDQKTR